MTKTNKQKEEEMIDVQYSYREYGNCQIPSSVVDEGEEEMEEYIRAEIDDADDIELISY